MAPSTANALFFSSSPRAALLSSSTPSSTPQLITGMPTPYLLLLPSVWLVASHLHFLGVIGESAAFTSLSSPSPTSFSLVSSTLSSRPKASSGPERSSAIVKRVAEYPWEIDPCFYMASSELGVTLMTSSSTTPSEWAAVSPEDKEGNTGVITTVWLAVWVSTLVTWPAEPTLPDPSSSEVYLLAADFSFLISLPVTSLDVNKGTFFVCFAANLSAILFSNNSSAAAHSVWFSENTASVLRNSSASHGGIRCPTKSSQPSLQLGSNLSFALDFLCSDFVWKSAKGSMVVAKSSSVCAMALSTSISV